MILQFLYKDFCFKIGGHRHLKMVKNKMFINNPVFQQRMIDETSPPKGSDITPEEWKTYLGRQKKEGSAPQFPDKPTTNAELARAYRMIWNKKRGGNLGGVCANLIAGVEADIPGYYGQHGTLKGLKTPGMGKLARSGIEDILKYGCTAVQLKISEEKDAETGISYVGRSFTHLYRHDEVRDEFEKEDWNARFEY